jgi:hypothetical protein
MPPPYSVVLEPQLKKVVVFTVRSPPDDITALAEERSKTEFKISRQVAAVCVDPAAGFETALAQSGIALRAIRNNTNIQTSKS